MRLTDIVAEKTRERKDDFTIREPSEEDGADIWRLVKASGSLDENSMYCNLLQCTHFASTCALAEREGEVVGWVSGYIPPDHPERLFVWQVCVRKDARGHAIGKRLIGDVLDRDVCADVTHINTTITDNNEASWALFHKVARSLGAELERSEHFEEKAHFDGHHETEYLVSIGPFRVRSQSFRTAA